MALECLLSFSARSRLAHMSLSVYGVFSSVEANMEAFVSVRTLCDSRAPVCLKNHWVRGKICCWMAFHCACSWSQVLERRPMKAANLQQNPAPVYLEMRPLNSIQMFAKGSWNAGSRDVQKNSEQRFWLCFIRATLFHKYLQWTQVRRRGQPLV